MHHDPLILLVGNFEPDHLPSMLRYVRVLEEHLPSLGFEVRLIRPQPRLSRLPAPGRGLAKWLGYADKYLLFPAALRREVAVLKSAPRRSLTHVCDHGYSPYVRVLAPDPHVVTCHDLLAVRSARGEIPLNPTRWTGRRYQAMIADGLRRAHHVACVSEHTRRELQRVCGLPASRITVVHNGLNGPFSPRTPGCARAIVSRVVPDLARAAASTAVDRDLAPYVLHVGAECWYKNRRAVVRAHAALAAQRPSAPHLVMVGPALDEATSRWIAEQGLAGRVHPVTRCSHDQLCALYSGAELLLFPSWEEGFGWPIIEAQACGCRVLTSNRQPMMEVGGEGAVYADPGDMEALARAMGRLLDAPPADRQALVDCGLRNAARFSTEQMIHGYAGLYRRLLG